MEIEKEKDRTMTFKKMTQMWEINIKIRKQKVRNAHKKIKKRNKN